MATKPRIVLGTMTIGPAHGNAHCTGEHSPLPSYCQTNPEEAKQQLEALLACPSATVVEGPEKGKVMIDTASAYQNWQTEVALGGVIASLPEDQKAKISVHTKANNFLKPYQCFSKESVKYQCNGSLERLRIPTIQVYYLHGPDPKTDIDEAIEAMTELHAEGKIQEFGLSNYPAWKVADIWHRCDKKGCIKPTVAQYCYNAISRDVEREAHAAFRELGIRSYHYNPLAGGLLTGKYDSLDDDRDEGRFGKKSPISGTMYSARYWKAGIFEAMGIIKEACAKHGIPPAEGALRWLTHHSILDPASGDGMIIGASSVAHAVANLNAIDAAEPLPDDLLEAYERAWKIAQPFAPPYFRGYSAAPGSSVDFIKTFQNTVPNSFP